MCDVLIRRDNDIYSAIKADGAVISSGTDAVTVIRAALACLSDGGMLAFRRADYILTGITSDFNNYSILPIPSDTIIDGNGSIFVVENLPEAPQGLHYNFAFFSIAGRNISIRNMIIDGGRDNNPESALEYLVIGDYQLQDMVENISIENVSCINSTRNGIVPRGKNWRVSNCTTINNKVAGIEFENITHLIISGHVSAFDYSALYGEGDNETVILNNFIYSDCAIGVQVGGSNSTMIGLSLANGAIKRYTNRAVSLGAGAGRVSITNGKFEGAGKYQSFIGCENGAGIVNCQIDGYVGLQGKNINISNSLLKCNYITIDSNVCTLHGCTIERVYRTSYRSKDILFDGCVYTNGIIDAEAENVQHIHCMGDS